MEPATDDEASELAALSLEDLLSITVVSAALMAEDAWDALAIIGVIPAKAFREYGHLSVGDALRFEPGFYPVYDMVTYNVGIRGVNGGMGAQSQVLRTMLDGRDIRFRPTGGSFFGPELVPRMAIRQVEIVRGPVSALYGADAFLGAVNVIPNRAADMGPGHARLELNTLSESANWGVQTDGAVWGRPFGIDSIVSTSYRDLERGQLRLPKSSPSYNALTQVLGTDHPDRDRERAGSVFARFERPVGHGSATVESNLQYFERGANFTFESSPLSEARVSLYNMGAALRLEQSYKKKFQLRAFSSYSRGGPTNRERLVDRLVQATLPTIERTLDYQTSETRAEATYSGSLSSRLGYGLTLGGDFTYDHVNTPANVGLRPMQAPLPLTPPSESLDVSTAAGFVQLRVNVVDWFRLLGGVRLEHHTLYGEQVSYRAGIGRSTERFATRLLFGRSFKAPSISLLYAEPVITGGPERNPMLEPQYAQTGELNVSYRPRRWAMFSVTGFVSKLEKLARVDTTGLTPRARNVADTVAYGGELEARIDHLATGIELFGNVAWAHAEEEQSSASTRSALYPELAINVGAQYHLPESNLRFVVLNRYASARAADPSNVVRNSGVAYELPGYDILRVGVHSEGLSIGPNRPTELGLWFDNVLLQRYAEPGFLGVDVPGQGWSIRASFSQTL